MTSHSSGSSTSGAGSYLFPETLKNAMHGEALFLGREQRTRTVAVEYRFVEGIVKEARVRSRELLVLIPLSS